MIRQPVGQLEQGLYLEPGQSYHRDRVSSPLCPRHAGFAGSIGRVPVSYLSLSQHFLTAAFHVGLTAMSMGDQGGFPLAAP